MNTKFNKLVSSAAVVFAISGCVFAETVSPVETPPSPVQSNTPSDAAAVIAPAPTALKSETVQSPAMTTPPETVQAPAAPVETASKLETVQTQAPAAAIPAETVQAPAAPAETASKLETVQTPAPAAAMPAETVQTPAAPAVAAPKSETVQTPAPAPAQTAASPESSAEKTPAPAKMVQTKPAAPRRIKVAPTAEPGYALTKDQYPITYNAPARIEPKNSWDFFFSGSFIYWFPEQDSMDLAVNTTYDTAYEAPVNGKFVVQRSTYKPGFQAELGFNFENDSWSALFGYTQFYQHTSMHKSTPPTDILGGTPLWRLTDFYAYRVSGYFLYANDIRSTWRTNFDILDASLCRSYYQGRQLTVRPFGGLRAAWIRQNLRLATTQFGTPPAILAWNPIISHNNSKCWAIGPRAGVAGQWLIGAGFRLEGDLAGSLLYSQYTVGHREDVPVAGGSPLSIRLDDYITLRPMAEMKMGLGWGTYYLRQKFHFDLLASYDFNMMWGQNMMRYLANLAYYNEATAPSDLTLQGLSVMARFDF